MHIELHRRRSGAAPSPRRTRDVRSGRPGDARQTDGRRTPRRVRHRVRGRAGEPDGPGVFALDRRPESRDLAEVEGERMRTRRIVKTAIVGAAVVVGLVAWATSAARAEEGATAAALKIAHQREYTTQQLYLADAARADEEGYPQVAVLFRALASAESVHVRNHAIALEALGVTPAPKAEPLVVRTTAENLQAGIDAEVYERRVAYARFMAHAREEHLYEPLASFRYARDAEITHAIRLAVAYAHLEWTTPRIATAAATGPQIPGVTYHVCPGCGCVLTEITSPRCECGATTSGFSTFVAPAESSAPDPLEVGR